eukprot:TRINITY_DN43614_c0_g1_i1.p1 TRINITY_DN43614_c0_g1~~TRINITY_DN43614_c0_g1_i1.p1  ORF type:complete len:310 (-),score=50.16 TRINITY_DN43614_c0_g1_i1:251-1096(-)
MTLRGGGCGGAWEKGGTPSADGGMHPMCGYAPFPSPWAGPSGGGGYSPGYNMGFGDGGGGRDTGGTSFGSSGCSGQPPPPAEFAGMWDPSSAAGCQATPPKQDVGTVSQTSWFGAAAQFAGEDVPAAAAAAVRQPTNVSRPENKSMHRLRLEQENKRRMDIRSAQEEAMRRRQAERTQAESGSWPGNTATVLEPKDIMGSWVDSHGNSVLVFSVDAWELRLQAVLSRPPRRDANLHLTFQKGSGGGWRCGNSHLDKSASSAGKLHWVREDGYVSIWTRGRS